MTTEELQSVAEGRDVNSHPGSRAIAAELIAARAKLAAADRLADAVDAWGLAYRGWSRTQLARRVDAPTERRFYDGESALAAWEAAK